MVFLKFEKVKKSFGKKEVLSEVSFDVKEKEIFGLIGVSGGGKTTLLKILVGMSRATGGKIWFEEKDVLEKPFYLRKNTGFATQKNMLFEELTLAENSSYFGKLYGVKRGNLKQRFVNLVELLGLGGFEDLQIRYFSGGMVKRANLLVALIHSPKLLILDEPTIGLDPILRENLWGYIHVINQEGTTILVTSHLLDEIEQNCSRVGILKSGKVVTLATIKEYKSKYGNKPFSKIFQEVMSHGSL